MKSSALKEDTPSCPLPDRPIPKFIIGVRIRGYDNTGHFDPGDLKLRVGQQVIVETLRGEKLGCIASNKITNYRKDKSETVLKVLRVATAGDLEAEEKKHAFEARAKQFCIEKIEELGLAMNLSRVIQYPELKKIVFYFTAEGRVDFRELVKHLAQNLKSKIELKQVGVRDEAKSITGLGMCGQTLCCSTFLNEFTPVTVRMAKDQGLALNPSKISGVCGRLMCCLQYEHGVYRQLIKNLPKLHSRVETPEGPGKVMKNEILQQNVVVRLDDESIMTYHNDDLKKPSKDSN